MYRPRRRHPPLSATSPQVSTPRFSGFDITETCVGTRAADVLGSCSVDFKYGFKRDFNTLLKTFGSSAPVQTLTGLRQFNTANASQGAIKYRQDLLDVSDEWI